MATALQTALRVNTGVAFATAEVEYEANPGRFLVTFSGSADNGSLFIGTSASVLGLDEDSGATYHPGAAEETLSEGLDAIIEQNDASYFLVLESDFNGAQAMLDASAWAATGRHIFIAESNEAGALTANETTSFAAQLADLQPPRTAMLWSKTADYKAMSFAARFSSVDFRVPGSLITGKFRTLVGLKPDDGLTSAQRAELDRKNMTYYVTVGGFPITSDGKVLNAGYIDSRFWLDWFNERVETDVYTLLRQSNRIPQTTAGVQVYRDTLSTVCQSGVRNGGIAPGEVSAQGRSDIQSAIGVPFDGRLNVGYVIWIRPLSEQSQSDRDARHAPTARIWVKGSGAIHDVDIDVTYL